MRPIVQKENPVLRQVAASVSLDDIGGKELQEIISDMREALAKEPDGVAIAAQQIAVSLRLFVLSPMAFEAEEEGKKMDPKEHTVYINPVITKGSRTRAWNPEGCLSVRWLYGNTERAEKVTVKAYDENGKSFTRGASGLLAQIFQHEIEHLDGILFIDHAKDLEEIPPEALKEYEKRKTS